MGLNKFTLAEREEIPPFAVDLVETERKAVEKVRKWRAERDGIRAQRALEEVKEVMRQYESVEQAGILMPALIDAARAKCTLGEMMEAIVGVSGGRVHST